MASCHYYDLSSGEEADGQVVSLPKLTHSLGSCALDDLEEGYLEDEGWAPQPLHVAVNVDEDDGWISDPDMCAPVKLSPHAQAPAVCATKSDGRKPYMGYEDDVWVDEAKGTFNTYKTSDPSKVTEVLREMFNAHDDVYSLLLAFLSRTGKVRMQKKSLPRMVLSEFQTWVGEQQEKPKNAMLTSQHRKEALQILTKCHAVLMDDLMAIFELRAAEKTAQLDLIDSLLVQDRLKEAVTYTWKFGLQDHFEMSTVWSCVTAQMLLPLIALDKINLIENYIEGNGKLQEEFVRILDDFCEPGTTQSKINSFISTCTLGPKSLDRDVLSKVNCKLNFKQLYRLAHRMVTKYKLDLSKFSHIHSRWSGGNLHHLLRMRYVENTITEDNIDDLLDTLVEDNKSLQLLLVKELFRFNDMAAAVKWAVKCDVPVDQLPYAVQVHLDSQSPPKKKKAARSEGSSAPKPEQPSKKEFHQLPLPLSSVVFVDNKSQLDACWATIKRPNTIIGIDAEWKLPSCNRGIERLAVLQLAVEDAVYLLDMVQLPRVVGESALRQFMITLFQSDQNLKLGYGIQCDLHMLSKSWSFTRDIVGSPVQVLDLQKLEIMVERLKEPAPVNAEIETVLPVHPLLRNHKNAIRTPCDLSCDSQLPRHPLLLLARNSSKSPAESQTIAQNGGVSVRDDPYGVGIRRGGLAKLVEKCFGKPLDKSQQLSDWEKRPLTPNQITYAALDAHCLLGVYKFLMAEAVTYDLSFSLKPALVS